MDSLFDKLKGNPRFAPELGSFWEGWMTPLKWNWRTHVIRISCKGGKTLLFLRYVPGDYVEVIHKRFGFIVTKTLSTPDDFANVEELLKRCEAIFVTKDVMANELSEVS